MAQFLQCYGPNGTKAIGLYHYTEFGWGRKRSWHRAQIRARKFNRNAISVEDGFLRSVNRMDLALSVVIDNMGIFYDASVPSQLELQILESLSLEDEERSRKIISSWRLNRLSKYNATSEESGEFPRPYILVCDQTFDDMSISHGLSDASTFARMLYTALTEYPAHEIVVKIHPDVTTRGKRGYFSASVLRANDRIRVLSDPVHPVGLIEHADAVYTVTSQLGFEALIWGKPVRCFGMPFYAGWGLTEDELQAPDRRKPVALTQLVHAALLKYPRYFDPVTLQCCEAERAFEYVSLQRRKRLELPKTIFAVGFSTWKRAFTKDFLQGSDVYFSDTFPADKQLDDTTSILVWGSADPPSSRGCVPLMRVEDGFLRSSGLGADLVRPLSLVVDDLGIYYDATKPSRLEHIFETQDLDASATERACALRNRILELDVTKYNLGKQSWFRPDTNERVLLVVGQVETDASIRLGSPIVKTNGELLKRVRTENPSAYIIYKPHPDVLAGLRRRGDGEETFHELADEILTATVSIGQLLTQVDQLHTITSLMGFEALIRGTKVVCHGMPFYAGWGLTEDRLTCTRRTRNLTVDELVFGALISYPRYFNYERKCFIEPEHAVEQLALQAKDGPITRKFHRKALRAAIVTWQKLRGTMR